MSRFARALLTGLVAALLWASVALAQQAPLVGIDPIRNALDQIEQEARTGRHGVRTLTELGQRLSPLREQMRDKLTDLEPRLAEVDARLKDLGPAPARDAPPEDSAIAAERTRLTQQRTQLDSAIKQVQLL